MAKKRNCHLNIGICCLNGEQNQNTFYESGKIQSYLSIKQEKVLQESNKNNSSLQSLESGDIKNIVIEAVEEAKGNEILAIEVSHLTQVTDYMIIVSGTSNRHIQTLAESAIKNCQKHGIEKLGVEGLGNSEWVVVDFADVVLHVMSPAAREHYNIEGLWDISSDTSQD